MSGMYNGPWWLVALGLLFAAGFAVMAYADRRARQAIRRHEARERHREWRRQFPS